MTRCVAPARAFMLVVVASLLLPEGAVRAAVGPPPFELGRAGGRLVTALRAEPKTFNPLLAVDAPSKEVIWRIAGDLIHINRETHATEPALATGWKASRDGRRYTVHLRRDVRFSDGHHFDADDVVFSFQAYLDERVGSPQRDLLVVEGQPIVVTKIDAFTVAVDMAAGYAAAERLFDSVAILPRHKLEAAWRAGRLRDAWGIGTPPTEIVGLGPFRLREYRPGERVVVERNPYYWQRDAAGMPLPYLDELVWVHMPSEEAQVIRFQSGQLDVLTRLAPPHIPGLERQAASRRYRIDDLGPGLEYNFLFFNLSAERSRVPFALDVRFRQAVSLAIDRAAVARLVFGGRASPIWGHVTPGNKHWINDKLPRTSAGATQARERLKAAGGSWRGDGALVDPSGRIVTFTLLAAAGNSAMTETATLIQADLAAVGIQVQIVPLEFRALLDRVLVSRDYDAALLRLGSGDVDPTAEMNVWPSRGATHLWNPGRSTPATSWEAEIDRLMQRQLTARSTADRKAVYDRVQAIVAEQLPIIPLVSPHIVVGATIGLGNLRPAVLDHYTLWNAERLFWREGRSR